MTQPTNSDAAYQEWLYEQFLRSQPTTIQDKPARVRESMPPYRSVEYRPPEPAYTPEPAHRRYKKLQRRRYPDWRQVLGWTCVAGAAMASFNLLLHGIKTVCPAPTQAVIAPPKPKPPKPKPPTEPGLQTLPVIPVPTPPPPRLLGKAVASAYWSKPLRCAIPGEINQRGCT